MYYPNRDIEAVCYKEDHINQVLSVIKKNFPQYFELYLETEAGNKITEKELQRITKDMGGSTINISRKKVDKGGVLREIISEAIDDFSKDRQSYEEILDLEALIEYEDDPSNFKNSVLRNSCPIIRLTLQNRKAKELDKYRAEFNAADPKDMLDVVRNITEFAIDYFDKINDEVKYENITQLKEMKLSELNGDDYTVYGVIGGGIKSHFLYKTHPSTFPNRGRESIWALWFITDKKTFDCSQDSEFLMLDLNKSTTQQNYFYPYDLFSFYAYNIYLLIRTEADKYKIDLDEDYRYVYVNSFLSFVAGLYVKETNFLRSQLREDRYESFI